MTIALSDSIPAFALPGTDGHTHSLADYDEDQSVARALGAERTPEVYVFAADRRLVYHGAVDDNRDEEAVSAHYLRDAFDAVLDGRVPLPSETPAVGCSVKWRS